MDTPPICVEILSDSSDHFMCLRPFNRDGTLQNSIGLAWIIGNLECPLLVQCEDPKPSSPLCSKYEHTFKVYTYYGGIAYKGLKFMIVGL